MSKSIKSFKGAPSYIKEWWARTNMQLALFRLVECGATWQEAHERLKELHTTWHDKGRKGASPIFRFVNRIYRQRIIERIKAGENVITLEDGRVAVKGSSFIKL